MSKTYWNLLLFDSSILAQTGYRGPFATTVLPSRGHTLLAQPKGEPFAKEVKGDCGHIVIQNVLSCDVFRNSFLEAFATRVLPFAGLYTPGRSQHRSRPCYNRSFTRKRLKSADRLRQQDNPNGPIPRLVPTWSETLITACRAS